MIKGLVVIFLSIFLTFIYPSSRAYCQPSKIFFPAVYKALKITVAWDPNSEPDLAGYKLYMGKSSGNYIQVIDVGLTTQYTISASIGAPPLFLALTAYNQQGLESGFSNEAQYNE